MMCLDGLIKPVRQFAFAGQRTMHHRRCGEPSIAAALPRRAPAPRRSRPLTLSGARPVQSFRAVRHRWKPSARRRDQARQQLARDGRRIAKPIRKVSGVIVVSRQQHAMIPRADRIEQSRPKNRQNAI
jgi:hypothetical protein